MARARLPLGFLGSLVIIAAVEAALGRIIPAEALEPFVLGWRAGGTAAEGPKAIESEVLFFGDSLIKHGLIPGVFRERSGLTAYNLAVPGAPPLASALLLRRTLEAGARPRAIVLDAEPVHLTFDVWKHGSVWAELADARDGWTLATIAGDPEVFGTVVARGTLPSARLRDELRTRAVGRLRGAEPKPDVKYVNRTKLRNWEANRGADVLSARARGGELPLAPEETAVLEDLGRNQRFNLEALTTIMEAAEAREIPVFWLLPPRDQYLREHAASSSLRDRQLELLRNALERYPHLVVLDAWDRGYGDEAFRDRTHLNRDGAICLSHDVAAAVASHLEGDRLANRWVALPAYGARPVRGAIEDFEQSQAIVLEERKLRKR